MTWTVSSSIIPTQIIAVGSYGVIAIGKFSSYGIQRYRNINLFSNHDYNGPDQNLRIKSSKSEALYGKQYRDDPNLQQFCIKHSLDLNINANSAKSFLLELELMKLCNHINIISLSDSYFDENTSCLTITMPRANCDLHQALYLWNDCQLYCKEIIEDILRAVLYLHHNKIVHRDLCLNNIFIFYNANNSFLRACVGDLGMACVINGPEETHQYFTTYPYRAPELFYKQGTTNPAVDIWSLGCIIAEIRQKRCIFSPKQDRNQGELMANLRQMCLLVPPHEMNLNSQAWIKNDNEWGKNIFHLVQDKYCNARKVWSDNWCSSIRHLVATDPLLQQCLKINPEDRIGIEELCLQCNLKVPQSQFQKVPFRHEEFIELNAKVDILRRIKKVAQLVIR